MKRYKMLGLVAASALVTHMVLFAAESNSGNWIDLQNRIRFEYDDNIYQRSSDKTDSFKIIEELELGITADFEPTFITLRYRPTFTWWENREPDDTDLHHDLDAVLNHRFSPRLSLGLKNTFRLAQNPEEIDRGTKIREEDDYIYNVTDGNIDYMLFPRTHAVLGGRYTILRYDRQEIANSEDYDIGAVGLTIRQRISDMTQFLVDLRHESISYDGADTADKYNRDSDSQYAGIGLEHTIGASFVGSVRGGYQKKKFSADNVSDESEPYGDVTVTYLFSPRTRLSVGAGYSMFESDVYPFASQNRTIVYSSLAYDITAKLSLYLSASYSESDYSQEQAITTDTTLPSNFEGSEEVIQGAVRLAYQLNARNSLEVNYQHMDMDSEFDASVREDFNRNRVSIGWRLDI